MARRTRVVTITDEGRDKGRSFLLTELPADQGEWWAIRMLAIVGNAGLDVPKDALQAGMAGLANIEAMSGLVSAILVVGLKMLPGVNVQALKPLLDEMMECVQYQPPGKFPPQLLMEGPLCQIEEIQTRLRLRTEWLELHLGFSIAGLASPSQTDPPPAPAS